MTKYEAAENLAAFLMETKGSVLAFWNGHMPAKQQRALFGRFLGKGNLVICGQTEEVRHNAKRCFGLDFETTACISWRDL